MVPFLPSGAAMRNLIAANVILVTTLFRSEALASEENVFQLLWTLGSGAEGCPSSERVARAVAAKLARDPFEEGVPRVIRGHVVRTAEGWAVHVDELEGDKLVDTRDGESAAPDCGAILGLCAFLVARLIETGGESVAPAAPSPALALPPPPSPALPLPAAPAPTLPSAPAASPALLVVAPRPSGEPEKGDRERLQDVSGASRRVGGGIYLGAVTGLGLLPGASKGPSVAATVGKGRLEVSSGMFFLPEVGVRGGAFSFGMTAGWLGGCGRVWAWGPLSLFGCAHVLGGAVTAIVHDIEPYRAIDPGARGWVAVSGAPRVRVLVAGPLTADLGVDVIVPITRFRFTAGQDEVFVQSPVMVLPFVRLGVSFPEGP